MVQVNLKLNVLDLKFKCSKFKLFMFLHFLLQIGNTSVLSSLAKNHQLVVTGSSFENRSGPEASQGRVLQKRIHKSLGRYTFNYGGIFANFYLHKRSICNIKKT